FADMSWKIAADEMTLGPTMSQGSSQGQAAHDMSAADLQGCIGPDRDLRHLAVTCHAASARQRVPSRGRLPRRYPLTMSSEWARRHVPAHRSFVRPSALRAVRSRPRPSDNTVRPDPGSV